MQMRKLPLWLIFLLIAVAGGLVARSVRAGGWAVVTLAELPESVVVDRPFTVHFTVRQHGLNPLGGLSPTVTAVHDGTGERVTAQAAETAKTGDYEATLVLPSSGQWHWSIDAFTATYTMPPLAVQAASAAVAREKTNAPWSLAIGIGGVLVALGMAFAWQRQPSRLRLAALLAALAVSLAGFTWVGQRPLSLAAQVDDSETAGTAVDRGEALFVAKGCIQCHQNGNVAMAPNLYPIGPDLTEYQASAAFLRMWLARPSSVKPGTRMPNLGLTEAEIENLIAFLGSDAQ